MGVRAVLRASLPRARGKSAPLPPTRATPITPLIATTCAPPPVPLSMQDCFGMKETRAGPVTSPLANGFAHRGTRRDAHVRSGERVLLRERDIPPPPNTPPRSLPACPLAAAAVRAKKKTFFLFCFFGTQKHLLSAPSRHFTRSLAAPHA